MQMKPNQKHVFVRKGRLIIHKILVIEFCGITTYSLKTDEYKNTDIYRNITEDEYNRILNEANNNGYFVYEKKAK
jgi:hypothetical protein